MQEFLSKKVADYAACKYKSVLPLLKGKGAKAFAMVDKLIGDEKILMEFLYGTMPLNDAAVYEPELFYSYVKHGIFLRESCSWTRELSEELFLDYVLCHRVNNEAITDCRGWFYEMLQPIVAGCTLEEAIKEVNYWCASQASYAASDERTLSPAAVFFSGSGRCGEESTFLVTALRSVGIAARQVYAPRWAHCDDNHAWVEAWADGCWRFLGACEPEEVLDKGWFTNASSRAMLVHTRVFSDYFNVSQEKPEITERDGAATLLNVTTAYARTSLLTVLVKDEENYPVSGARVSFELLNAAEYKAIAELYTDKEGKVCLTLGLGSIQIRVAKGGCYKELLVENDEIDIIEVVLSKERSEKQRNWEGQQYFEKQRDPAEQQHSEQQQNSEAPQRQKWQYFDHKAPRDFPMHPVKLTEEQKERGRKRKQEAEQRRRGKLKGFEEQAERLAEDLLEGASEPLSGLLVKGILKKARGNVTEIYRFLKAHPGKEALEYLSVFTLKDYRDICAELLEEHFIWGRQVKEFSFKEYLNGEEQPEELFLQLVWNPRIGYEEIMPYRSFWDGLLTMEQKRTFCREPEKIWEWIRDDVQEIISCEEKEQHILFVEICRTLGIPARLHPATKEAEYFKEHRFHNVVCSEKDKKQVRLILTSQEKPEYYASWTIGRLIQEQEPGGLFERFETLDFTGKEFEDGTLTLLLPEGVYRVITTVRLPDGNQLEARRILDGRDFLPGKDKVPECMLSLHFRKPEISQMLEELALESFSLHQEDGTRVTDQEVTEGRHTLLAFLEEGAEPTEHLLNELLERQGEVAQSGLKVVFTVTRKDALMHPTLAEAVRCLGAQVYYDDFQELPEVLARRMYTDPEKLPLVLLISPGRIGRYASSGYNVGSVGLLLRIAGIMER